MIYVDLPFLNSSNLKDGITYMSRLPIPLSEGPVTLSYPNNQTVSLHSDMPPKFKVRVYDKNGNLFNGIKYLFLQFNYLISNEG